MLYRPFTQAWSFFANCGGCGAPPGVAGGVGLRNWVMSVVRVNVKA